MNIFDNNINRLFDDLVVEIKKGGVLSIASASFSIYSFHELKKQLESIDELRFIFTSPVTAHLLSFVLEMVLLKRL